MSNSQRGSPALVTIWVLREQFTPEQKAEMIRRVSEVMADVIGRSVSDPTWVVIEEIHRGDWWFGGPDADADQPSEEGGG